MGTHISSQGRLWRNVCVSASRAAPASLRRTVSVPAAALATPPETGASTKLSPLPRDSIRLPKVRAKSGGTVEHSTIAAPSLRAVWRPEGQGHGTGHGGKQLNPLDSASNRDGGPYRGCQRCTSCGGISRAHNLSMPSAASGAPVTGWWGLVAPATAPPSQKQTLKGAPKSAELLIRSQEGSGCAPVTAQWYCTHLPLPPGPRKARSRPALRLSP